MRIERTASVAPGWVPAMLGLVVLMQGCNDSQDPLRLERGMIMEAVEPVPSSGSVGRAVIPTPAVRVTDAAGQPVKGAAVNFRPGGDSGSVFNDLALTDADGLATPGAWTLGPTPGSYELRASGPAGSVVNFRVVAIDAPTSMYKVVGDGQMAPSGTALPVTPTVEVVGWTDNPLAGVPVSFEVLSGGGVVEWDTVETDAGGRASPGSWTLGGDGDIQLLRATAGLTHVAFMAATGVPSGPGGQLAFVSSETGDAEIYLSNADGSQRQRLTTSPGLDFHPAWSPDGSRLAFASERDAFNGIYTMAPDGSGVERVADGGFARSPAWSPDGGKIAFESALEGSSEVMAIDLSDSSVTFITSGNGYEGQPAWSPDGARLAYVSDEAAYDFVYDVYTSNADGSEPRLLTDGPFFWPDLRIALHPTWSPDGTMIAYVYGSLVDHQRGWSLATPVRFRVGLMTAQGDFVADIATIGDMPWSSVLDPGPISWSPDGLAIAYTSLKCPDSADASCTEVRYAPLVGGSSVRITDGWGPAWRP